MEGNGTPTIRFSKLIRSPYPEEMVSTSEELSTL